MEIICCALKDEELPLKKHFDNSVRFECCGVCAKRLSFLKELDPNDHVTNIGVCAGSNIGELYLCNKIIGKKIYYPDLLIPNNIKQSAITTVDYLVGSEEIATNPNMLYDQEAAMIFAEAQKYISPHQISFLKIVSDSGVSNFDKVRKEISRLIEDKIPEIETFILNSKKIYTNTEQIDISKYIEILKPSITMQNRLKQQFRYAQIQNINTDEFFDNLPKITSKQDSLKALEAFDKFLISNSI